MDGIVPETKYQKLATEYSKLRAQASVLKKAVLEEQAKEISLREQLRQRETALRRTEQEVDSLSFRNKQLESRVGALQQEFKDFELRKKKDNKENVKRNMTNPKNTDAQQEISESQSDTQPEELIFDELQKKVMENAQLTSLIEDKDRDLELHAQRISNLEQKLEKHLSEQNNLEKRLRKEIEQLQNKNCELETKLLESTSVLGSEDALSATSSDSTPLHNIQQQILTPNNVSLTTEERMGVLEKEIAYWRAQYEVVKLKHEFTNNIKNGKNLNAGCSCSTTAAGLTVKKTCDEHKSNRRSPELQDCSNDVIPKEQLIFDAFSKKYEDLLYLKCQSESRLRSFETEVTNLQNCLESTTSELKIKDTQLESLNVGLQMLEEDLSTTRINYEEQIKMLTEQVISLSEQLAASK